MRQIQVYIEGQKLDLFEDEQINVTSKQQDINDISKVFSDYSQSFSVPSTPNNDSIFSYFYNSDYGDFQDVTTQFDVNVRKEALIEIDYTTFRRGKIQLEKAEIKDNRSDSYQITFYGEVTSLKDKFGDEKLADLTYLATYGHAYTGAEVQNRITDGSTNYVMRYPIITDRIVTYQDGASTDISSTGTDDIAYNELFPAVKIIGIFAAIEIKYGLDFQGAFLQDKRFQNCFLWCKNKREFTFLTSTQDVNFTTGGQLINQSTYTYLNYFNTTDNTLNYTYYDWFSLFPTVSPGPIQVNHGTSIEVLSVSTSDTYYIDVYINDVLSNTLDGNGAQEIIVANDQNVQGLNKSIYFRFRSTATQDIQFRCKYQQLGTNLGGGTSTQVQNIFYADTNTITVQAQIDPIAYLPDMKIADFFNGVLKEFNLTCYGIEEDVYQVEPLDDWYNKGAIVNITEYTDIKSIKIDRIKLFKNILFKYEKSENILNNQFRENNNREYGDAQIQYPYDGGEYKIEQPFENMQFNKFTGTNLQVGYTVDKDLNSYVPKPMLLYMYDETSATFRYDDGSFPTAIQDLTEYMPFGQDMTLNGENYTLNFNAEISTFTLVPEQNTLFAEYYFGYLSNLFSLKNRRTTLKANLPVSLLTSLRLNDRVIIRDKRYIIESMKSNLNTGDVDFVLINDFRPVLSDSSSQQEKPIPVPENANCVDVKILLPVNCVQADVTTTDAGVTITPSTLTSDGFVEVCLPANNNTNVLKTEDDADYINTEDLAYRIKTEQNDATVYTLTVTYTFSNGLVSTNNIYITQAP
jgi:hypothetical protein